MLGILFSIFTIDVTKFHLCGLHSLGRLLGAVVVIAANAGGAWTPIGDVTTTMLWIHGQISTLPTMKVPFVITITMKTINCSIAVHSIANHGHR